MTSRETDRLTIKETDHTEEQKDCQAERQRD
jgi:hypothetical protein